MTAPDHAFVTATSVSAALSMRGLDVSPALVFGLGEGLAFCADRHAALPLVGHTADFAGRAVARLGGSLADDGTIAGDLHPPHADDVRDALVTCARAMDAPADSAHGLDGLAAFLDDIPTWGTADAPAELAARASRCIADDGASGALCRRLYRDFLRDADALLPALGDAQMSISMTRVADAWATLGSELRQVATDDVADFAQAARFALAVQTFEETFWARVLDRFADDP